MFEKTVSTIRIAYFFLAWLFLGGIIVQVYLVGLSLFVSRSGFLTQRAMWEAHIGLGHWIGVLPLLMLVLVFLGRFPPPVKVLTASLFGLYLLQSQVFAIIRQDAPVVAALHPVLALLLFILSLSTARHSLKSLSA